MTTDIATLKAKLDAANAKYADWRDVQCEGYDNDDANPYRREVMDAAGAYEQAVFWSRWTREFFDDRRAAWNAGLRQLPGFSSGRVRQADVVAMADRLGVTEYDLIRAKKRYVGA